MQFGLKEDQVGSLLGEVVDIVRINLGGVARAVPRHEHRVCRYLWSVNLWSLGRVPTGRAYVPLSSN